MYSHDRPAVRIPREVRSPAIDCEQCGALIYIADVECWRCHRRFGESELRDRWDNAPHHP